MERAKEEQYKSIVEYMERDIANCIYMYIDITTYGLNSEQVKTWIDVQNGRIVLIAMKYYDSFQLFSINHDYSREGLLELLAAESPARINGDKEIISEIWDEFDQSKYSLEYGTIMKITNYVIRSNDSIEVLEAEKGDVEGIADLIMNEPELNGGFTKNELMEQTAERIENGYGSSYIIKEGDEIVAHNCINAECDKFLVGALTVVRPDRRDTLYGSILDAHLSFVAIAKGKDFYAFLKDPRRIKMFKAMRNEIVGEYGRIKLI